LENCVAYGHEELGREGKDGGVRERGGKGEGAVEDEPGGLQGRAKGIAARHMDESKVENVTESKVENATSVLIEVTVPDNAGHVLAEDVFCAFDLLFEVPRARTSLT